VDNETGKDAAEILQRAEQVLAELEAIRSRAEATVASAEASRSKADSESGFAFNAKNNAEEHAKAISQVRGNVDADFTWLTTTKKNAEEAAQAIALAKAASEGDAQSLANLKSTAQQDAQLATTARSTAETISASATKMQGDISAALAKANEDSASLAQAKATSEASATAVQGSQAQVAEYAAKAKSDGASISARDAESQTHLQSIANIVLSATETHTRVETYETDLTKLKEQFAELHAKTEALLPGATSAGLASAFREQKARFDRPQTYWLWTFVGAVALLLAAGLIGLPGVFGSAALQGNDPNPPWDAILRHIVNRLPLVGPLVWLGIYAGRNYMLALRMQDEYAFKEAVSATFEGYKREMAAIKGLDGTASPLVTLCENVLGTLAERPGRIYEGKHEDITPLAPISKAVADIATKLTDQTGKVVAKIMDDLKASG
jgi:chemotaxis protein histidine kinase CheA